MKNSYYIELLRNKIENKFSFRIDFKNTDILLSEILESTNERISPSTLQRFFNLVSTNSKPAKSTLNILSIYVGCSNWDDFIKSNVDAPFIEKGTNLIVDDFGITLLSLCFKNQNFETIIEYIKMLPLDFDYEMERKLCTVMGKFIRKDKMAQKILLPELAKIDTGRKYFFEYFVDVDYTNDYYANAIASHYTKHITYFKGDKQIDDLVFSASIQFIAFLKKNNIKLAIKTANILFKKVAPFSEFTLFSHPFPFARLQSIYLISEQLKKQLTQQKVDAVLHTTAQVLQICGKGDFTFVLAQIIVALNYIGRHSDVLDVFTDYRNFIEKQSIHALSYETIRSAVFNSCNQLNIVFPSVVLNQKTILELEFLHSCQNKIPLI